VAEIDKSWMSHTCFSADYLKKKKKKKKNLWRFVERRFLQAGCPSCHPTISVKPEGNTKHLP